MNKDRKLIGKKIIYPWTRHQGQKSSQENLIRHLRSGSCYMNCSKQLKMREIFLPNFINITLISILHKTNIKIGTNCKLILLMNMYANISLIFFYQLHGLHSPLFYISFRCAAQWLDNHIPYKVSPLRFPGPTGPRVFITLLVTLFPVHPHVYFVAAHLYSSVPSPSHPVSQPPTLYANISNTKQQTKASIVKQIFL